MDTTPRKLKKLHKLISAAQYMSQNNLKKPISSKQKRSPYEGSEDQAESNKILLCPPFSRHHEQR